MVISANFDVSYELRNYPQLEPLINKAKEILKTDYKFCARLSDSLHNDCFDTNHQISKESDKPKRLTIGELCDSYKYETVAQQIDPKAVSDILFGSDGLIRKKGGGRFPYLMEDIEVAQVQTGVFTFEGPIISSGRNRLLALQIMLYAAGAPEEHISNCNIRVNFVKMNSHEELQRRIISANTGSRTFSRSEIREREGARNGVLFVTKDEIKRTIDCATNQKSFSSAVGAYLKLVAADLREDYLTPAQYSTAGTNLWNRLNKEIRPNNQTFYSYIRSNTERFNRLVEHIETLFPTSILQLKSDLSSGQKTTKLAKILFEPVSSKIKTALI
jgi:hypothetical protein|tara:strand:+ start:409 stop:1398 length:990 start_codon:yes stop_codon:yes gene_type:complete